MAATFHTSRQSIAVTPTSARNAEGWRLLHGDNMANRICPCGFSVPKGTPCRCQAKRKVERQAQADAERGTPAQRGYDKDWYRVRHAHLQVHPLCVVCGAKGTHVDHIQSVRETPNRRLDPTNLRTMCAGCHSRRTARDQSQAWRRVLT